MKMMTMLAQSVSYGRSSSLGTFFRRCFPSMVVKLSVLLLVLSAGRCSSFSNGVPGTKLGAMVKGGIATSAALSAATSTTITGALTKIPQGQFAVTALLSAGTVLFSADQVEADNDGINCKSTNYPGTECEDVTIQGCGQIQSNADCCQGDSSCEETSCSKFGCCSCNDKAACQKSQNAVFFDNVCNGEKSCYDSDYMTVYSGSCNNQYSCTASQYLTVGSGSCNGSGSCAYCCYTESASSYSCENYNGNGNIVIPDGECNDPGTTSSSGSNNYRTTCPWCPYCGNTYGGTSCYNTLLTGQATLNGAGITDRRILQKKTSKQKNKTSKKTPMSCGSAKDKIVSYFQAQGIPKLRSKYTIGKLAKTSKQEGQRKRSRNCNVELSWLFEHLEGDEIVQACAELENHKTKLQAYLGKDWTIKNLKCIPEDKNKIA